MDYPIYPKQTYVLRDNSSLEEAVAALEASGMGFIACVDENGFLKGILTDGDLRRGILNKTKNLLSVINTSPQTLSVTTPKEKIISVLRQTHRRHMPLVDEEGRYRGVFCLDDVEFNVKPNKVVIMAGGLGKRLGALTQETPKPMLRVGDKPMLEHLIGMFSEKGYLDFIFCVNYKKDIIKKYFENGERFGVNISYAEESTHLGTAGPLSLVHNCISSTFLVVNADVLTTLNFEELHENHQSSNAIATMCYRKYHYQIPYGVVNTSANNQVVSIEEKPRVSFNVNAGIYVFEPSVFEYIPKGVRFDMPGVFEKLIYMDEKINAFEVSDYWIDIGSLNDYEQAHQDFNIKHFLENVTDSD